MSSVYSTPGNASTNPATLDSLDHLARVQALLIYQLIGLDDCNVRLRHLAEPHSRAAQMDATDGRT